MKKRWLNVLVGLSAVVVTIISSAGAVHAQIDADWTEPFPAFKIAGNLYYVGSKGLANYLIATPQGHILINSDLEENVPLIRASVEKLGFKFSDIKILLISHAHWDHCAGSASIKKLTAAKYHAVEGAWRVVDRALDLAGGFGIFKKGPFEQMFRDARLGRLHPANSALTHELCAKLTLGINPDEAPRWG